MALKQTGGDMLPCDRANRKTVKVGLVLSNRAVFPLLRVAIERLSQLEIEVQGYLLTESTESKYASWVKQLEVTGGIAVWFIASEAPFALTRALATNSVLPAFCQVMGSDARNRQADLISTLGGMAYLPANRPLDAVKVFCQLGSLVSRNVAEWKVALDITARESGHKEITELQRLIDAAAQSAPTGPPQTTPAPVSLPPSVSTEEDEALLREVEEQMRPKVARKEDRPKPPPKKKTLDYSIPLRKVLSTAREVAAAYSHPAVQAEHLLAAIIDLPETTAHQALLSAGAHLENLAGHLIAHFPPGHDSVIPGVFALDDSANQLLASAKAAARKRSRSCLTSLDFLEGLALYASGGATSSLWESGLLAKDILEAIDAFPADIECGELKEPEPEKFLNTADLAAASQFMNRTVPGDEPVEAKRAAIDPPAESVAPPPPEPEVPPRPKMLVTNSEMPGVEEVEQVSDALLEGRLVAFPIDTMFALVADATNPRAVQRLREAAGLEKSRPVGVIIHSMAQMRHLARGISAEANTMLDEVWPGPLTVVMGKHPQGFLHLNSEPSLALRIPADFLSLSILSTVGRPLAVTSVDPHEAGGVIGAKQAADRLAGKVDAVVDTREAPEPVTTTVLSMTDDKPVLLREGAVSLETLKTHLPNLATPEKREDETTSSE